MNIMADTLNGKQSVEFDGLLVYLQIEIGPRVFHISERDGLLMIRSRDHELWVHPTSANGILVDEKM
jgi:hypothetical protein